MCLQAANVGLWLVLFLTLPFLIVSGPVAGPEISSSPLKPLNSLNIQQPLQQQQQQAQASQQTKPNINHLHEAQLNSLSVYATNYDAIAERQNQIDKFKASYKLPEMETNFTPIQNSNSMPPELAAPLATHAPVLMQYLPQTINEGGIQYLQLIPTRPLMVPLGSYMGGANGLSSPLAYHQPLTANNGIDYASRPLLSALPVNMPPPAPASLVDVSASPLPAYNMQSYAGGLNNFKQNHRINRETKNKPVLGPISLNLNEYLPQANGQPQANFHIQPRP